MSRFFTISIMSLALLMQGCGEASVEDAQANLEDAMPTNVANRVATDIVSSKPSSVTSPSVSTQRKDKSEHLDYDVEYSISGDEVTQKFCSNLLNNFPTHLDQIISYDYKSLLRDKLTASIPKISSILSGEKVDLQHVKWAKVSDDRKKEVYFNTLVPLKLQEYARDGRIKSVSITTVAKWEKHFLRDSQKYDYWESQISGSQYTLYRITNFGAAEHILGADLKFSTQENLTNFTVYIELDGIALERKQTASAIIKVKNDERLFFISVYEDSHINDSLGAINVNIFQPSLAPGEKPYEFDHPWGKRTMSGPLRHLEEEGCRFTIFRKH